MAQIESTWQRDTAIATLSTMQCGSTARYVTRPVSVEDLEATVYEAERLSLPIKVIGGGSNLVFSDDGFDGVLIQPQFRQLLVSEASAIHISADLKNERYRAGDGYLHLQASKNQVEGRAVVIEAGADVPWGQLVSWTLQQRLHGLHWYARIPCRVGGAIYNNIHAAEHLLQEVVTAVEVFSITEKKVCWYQGEELDFGYDYSRFHHEPSVIISARFQLVEVDQAQNTIDTQLYRDWLQQKTRVQPAGANSGSVFKNVTAEQAHAIGQKELAAGWYVDQTGLKGHQVGGMQVFLGHGNFIINTGTGRQSELISLINEIRVAVHARFGIWLEPEVELIDHLGKRFQWPQTGSI